MTSSDILRSFTEAGFDEADARSRAALVARAVDGFRASVGTAPARAWFVPGRIEVFGKHTDYAGGRSLVVAVPRGFAVVASPRADGRVRVIDARYGGQVELDPIDEVRPFAGWTRYVAVVARRFAQNFPGATLGADLAIASDLPRAAGVSSSSALVVGLATALVDRARLDERDEWRAAITSVLDLAGYLGATENGLTFGSLAGTSGVGTHGGSEDHTAILTCRPGRLSEYAYVPVVHQGDAPMPPAWRFIVASSGVEADKAGGARERYNRASLATRALLEVWNRHQAPQPTLAAALRSSPEAESLLRELCADAPAGFDANDLRIRLAHFAAEDARVPQASHAFRNADAREVGRLSVASQNDADRWLGNQIPETRRLASIAREQGAFAASSFGAGFGGSVWALALANEAASVGERWVDAYRAQVNAPKLIEQFVVWPGPGVVKIS